MSSELAIRDSGLEPITTLRQQLQSIASIEEIHEALARVSAYDAYALAVGSRELTNTAVEARLWIEHRAGQLLAPQTVNETLTRVMHEHEVPLDTLRRWLVLGGVTAEQLEVAIKSVRADRDLTMRGVQMCVLHAYSEQVEPGIWRLPDGRLQVRVKVRSGEVRRIVKQWAGKGGGRGARIHVPSIERARQVLALEKATTRKAKPLPQREHPDLRAAYAELRKALQHLDGALASLPPEARKSASGTIAVMHRAEDKLIETMKLAVT